MFINDDFDSDTALAYTFSTAARDATKDISLGLARWEAATRTGNILYFVNNITDVAVAYNATTRARMASSDITLVSGDYDSAASSDDTIWVVDRVSLTARAYNVSDRLANTSKNIALTGFSLPGASVANNFTLWILNGSVFTAFNTADGSRDSVRDIDLGHQFFRGATIVGNIIFSLPLKIR